MTAIRRTVLVAAATWLIALAAHSLLGAPLAFPVGSLVGTAFAVAGMRWALNRDSREKS
jgi:hypothetical protein